MRVLAVDDESAMLERLTDCIREVIPYAETAAFQKPSDACAWSEENSADIAFLDIQMRGMNGIELGAKLRERMPHLNIIYITAYAEHALDAWNLNASGYLLKPVDPVEMKKAVENLRYPVRERVTIRCFGNFDILIDGRQPAFKYVKTKELLAYLVDRQGASCSMNEIMGILWEDEDHISYLQNLRKDLFDTLKAAGCEEILHKSRGRIGIRKELVLCDYYNWREGKRTGENAYLGEYMSQYSWAEETNGMLADAENG